MLHVTNSALSRLAVMLEPHTKGSAVRIVTRGGRLKLRRDLPRTGDATFTFGDRTVLVVDAKMSGTLSLRTLDTRQTRSGPRLRMRQTRGSA